MATFVKEYDWMWSPSGLNLSPSECRVYAYIYGLTESKNSKIKGYSGSIRQLAKDLGLSLGTTSAVLRNLQDNQLIINHDGALRSVQFLNNNVQFSNNSVQIPNESVQFLNPHTPIYINKEKGIENNNACDTIATLTPQPLSSISQNSSSFQQLLSAYKAQNDNANPSAEILATARNLWDNLSDCKQQQLLRAIQSGSWNKPRLDWAIADFRFREPVNYAGQPMPSGYSYFRASYNGVRGVYTRQDVDEFQMSDAEHFMDL